MKLTYHYNIGADGKLPNRLQRHKMERSFTLMVDNIPTQEEAVKTLLPAMGNPQGKLYINMPLAATIVNPNEQFDRKLGRKRAEEGLAATLVEVFAVSFWPNATMELHLMLGDVPVTIKVLKSGRPVIDDENARFMMFAIRGDWLAKSRAEAKAGIAEPMPDDVQALFDAAAEAIPEES
jgi:hypothetical protein